MKNRAIVVTAILLIASIGNYFRMMSDSQIRTVEFLSIFAMGALTAILLTLIIKMKKKKK